MIVFTGAYEGMAGPFDNDAVSWLILDLKISTPVTLPYELHELVLGTLCSEQMPSKVNISLARWEALDYTAHNTVL